MSGINADEWTFNLIAFSTKSSKPENLPHVLQAARSRFIILPRRETSETDLISGNKSPVNIARTVTL